MSKTSGGLKSGSPMMVRRQLGRRLRAMREATGRSRDDVVASKLMSRSKLEGSSCVEMRRRGRAVQVRDSKDPSGPILAVSPEQFAAWVHAAADGEFGTALD